ncbi:golgin subfamily A member 2 [Eupeodes corollae]|uniref:golgin subfamily A member 2 n=1 Tax=Eupeodes corollae TaxID=290404 RepID=UPI0024920389|nr:golgin subfamily A member 2 [Eupeodes corollae]
MPEDSKENKAKKLAAARKKLKEYQSKEKKDSEGAIPASLETQVTHQNDATSSEGSEPIVNESPSPAAAAAVALETGVDVVAEPMSYNEMPSAVAGVVENLSTPSIPPPSQNNNSSSIDTIQILITEKAALSSELNMLRNFCREKELENEELQAQFQLTSKRLQDLQNEFTHERQSMNEFKSKNLTLQVQLEETRSKYDDQAEHLEETKKLFALEKDRSQSLSKELKEAKNELELTKIRINQLSDEASVTQDNRVESLTQTQFMYEQQIRDLQAMVQQLTSDKEQSNQQYQTYVQHLNTEVTALNEKNGELAEECSKLQERERQFIDHISGLEKEIQKSISRQDQVKENQQQEANEIYIKEIEELKTKITDFDSERYEFQLKIKSQEDRLEGFTQSLIEKENKIAELEDHLQNILSERPDSHKLLATMESDKIAASRALSQNDALKKQLDELELRFVQLTNDKADLMNKLDAEEYANRETRNNFSSMEEQIKTLQEKLNLKDEEMIRLTHENNDIARKNLMLQQQLDRLQHYEASEYSTKYQTTGQESAVENGNDPHGETNHHHDHHDHNHDHCHNYDYGEDGHSHDDHSECSSGHAGHDHRHSLTSSVDEPDHPKEQSHVATSMTPQHHQHKHRHDEPPTIPTIEALTKLQNRFTKLMAQTAELTEEKQRLEHLVLQLQGETETIGEYIALYQTQRRILKQREYEKAAQLQLLLGEREEMREKITTLNKLVSNLGVDLPNNLRLNEDEMENICIEPTSVSHTPNSEGGSEGDHIHHTPLDEAVMNKRLNSNESKEILAKIQNIITEIKENTKDIPPVNTADHLTCCSGKFEIV